MSPLLIGGGVGLVLWLLSGGDDGEDATKQKQDPSASESDVGGSMTFTESEDKALKEALGDPRLADGLNPDSSDCGASRYAEACPVVAGGSVISAAELEKRTQEAIDSGYLSDLLK